MTAKTRPVDVAAYILNKRGPMTALKLQKLLYYAQAWSLVWDDRPLFQARIEAWANGPVIPVIYRKHAGMFELPKNFFNELGDVKRLDKVRRATIDAVLEYYGDRPSSWLSDLTHREPPWKEARSGLGAGDRGHEEIQISAMAEYYGGLTVGE